MKTPEDEAFDELARKQGAWGGGFKAKQAMAADKINSDFDEEYKKMHEDRIKYGTSWSQDGKRIDPTSVYKEQPAQEPVREALKLALEVMKINLTLLEKVDPYEDQEDLLSDALDVTHKTIASIKEALAQPLPVQEPVANRLERLLWEYIDLQAAHPEHKPNPKTWPHLMTYAPLPAQEPVGSVRWGGDEVVWTGEPPESGALLYTTQPQREWVGLTDDEIKTIVANYCLTIGNWSLNGLSVAQAVAAKLKDKNTCQQ